MRSRIGAAKLLSDDWLARRAVQGDERAFAAIFDRYHQDLYRFCLAIVGSSADAQDALQNTMVKVLRALPGEQRQIELKPWLYRIAHNESIELLRRRRPTEQLDPELMTRGGSPAEELETRTRLRRLLADLEQLPDRQRGTLVMRELGGLDFEEIGSALGTSPATARQTLYEARQSLRQIDEGREMNCDAVTKALSDADGRVTRRRDIRAHLRGCPDCRRFRAEIEGRREDLGALAPLPAIAATGLLQGLLGSAATSGGAGAAIKSAAAVVAVAAVGVGAADRSGVVDVTPWGGGTSQTEQGSGGSVEPVSPPPGSEAPEAANAGGAGGAATERSAAALDQGARTGNGSGPENAADGGRAADPGGVNGDEPSVASPGSGGSHPRGRGHEKQHPDSASHGQQTAASHKAEGKGIGQGQGGGADKDSSTKQAKPSKPTKPSDGGAVVEPPKAPAVPGVPHPPHPNPSPQGEAKGNPHTPAADEASLDG